MKAAPRPKPERHPIEACREQEAEKVEDMASGGIITEDEAEGLLERIWR